MIRPATDSRALGLRSAAQVVAVFNGSNVEKRALATALGEEGMHAMVLAIKLEGNYDRVSSWRCVKICPSKETADSGPPAEKIGPGLVDRH